LIYTGSHGALSLFVFNQGIHLEVQWILRSLNQQGDHVSRLIDTDDWQITNEFFLFLDEHWGHYTVAGLFGQFLQSQAL